MADITKTIEIVFGASDNTASAFKSIGDGLDQIDGVVQGIAAPLASATDKILVLDAALLALGATLTTVAVNQAGKFTDATNEINTLLDITDDQFASFQSNIVSYARDSTQSVEDINQAVYNAISAGADYSDSLTTLAEAEKLAVAGKADLNTSTVLLQQTMNAYGLEVTEVERVSDLYFATVKGGVTTLPQLAASMSQVTSTASAAGVPLETITAAIAALTKQGFPTEQAITGISAALSNMLKPTKDATDTAEALGVEFGYAALQSKGLEGLLWDLWEATGGNVDQMAKFFGSIQGFKAAVTLASDEAGFFQQALDEMAASAGSTSAAYEKMADNFELINQRFRNNLTATFIEFGTPLLDEYAGSLQALEGIFEGISLGFDAGAFDPIYNQLEEAAGIIEEFLSSVAANLPAALEGLEFDKLTEALDGLGVSIKEILIDLIGDIDLTTVEGLHDALQLTVDAFGSLVNVTAGIVDGFQPIAEAIGEFVRRLAEGDAETEKVIGQVLAAGKVLSEFGTYIGGFLVALGQTDSDITKTLNHIVGGAGAVWNSLQIMFDGFVRLISATTVTLNEAFLLLPDILIDEDEIRRNLAEAEDAWAASKANMEANMEDFERNWDLMTTGVAESTQKIPAAAEAAAKGVRDSLSATADIEVTTGNLNKSMLDLSVALAEQGIQWDVSSKAMTAAAHSQEEINAILDAHYGTLEKTNEALDKTVTNTRTWTDELGYQVTELTLADGSLQYTSELVRDVGDAQEEAAEQAKKAAEEAAKFRLEMEKLASNERIAVIEAQVKIDLAELEADKEQVLAAFDSINQTIQNTGDVLTSLYGQFTSADSLSEKFKLDTWIDREYELREAALAKQNELIDAQIDHMEARTDALTGDRAMIEISAAGLEPELEAFMFKILKRIQVQASQDGAEFLLGVI